jgi:hypothetical protein
MMMRCLATGIDPLIDSDADQLWNGMSTDSAYIANPNGFYQRPAVLLGDCDSKLVKAGLRNQDWPFATSGDYLVVWIERDETERTTSFLRAFGRSETDAQLAQYAAIETALDARTDCHITKIGYADTVNNPVDTFIRLQQAGWPIDPAKCAAFVDRNLYRNQLS